ncbi:MAG: hypothetical protein E3K37_15310 [Candidatus Kuenenia sp.]|nr:hypothetical protein [Candidatus Kuenenia hertensis]
MLTYRSKILGVVLCGVASICFSSSVMASKQKAEAAPEQQQETGETKQKDDSKKVVATINGEDITQAEVERVLNRFKNQIPPDRIASVEKQVLEGLVAQKLFLQFIKEKKITVGDDVLNAELDKVREDIQMNPGLAGKSLEEVLESHGSTVEDLKRDIIISMSLEKFFAADVADEKVREYFEKNKQIYDGTEVKASHILVDTRNAQSEEDLKKAKAKIDKIKSEVAEGKKDFAKLAEEYSDCPSAKKGGDLGYFQRKGQMVEPFAAVAFALKVGEVSDVVQTQFGYHIIKVTDIKQGEEVNFDDLKPEIKLDMLKQNADALLNRLKQQAKIEIK